MAEGRCVGVGEGRAVVGSSVGMDEGEKDGGCVGKELGANVGTVDGACVGGATGTGEGTNVVGCRVGGYARIVTLSGPNTTDRPLHAPLLLQPCLTRYSMRGVLAATVNCTVAHTSPPLMHAGGGRSPLPKSS